MKPKRAIVFELNHLAKEQQIILGHLTYHAARLWNQANYLEAKLIDIVAIKKQLLQNEEEG